MKWTITVAFASLCAALLFVFWKGFGKDPHAVPFMLAGKPAPEFTLRQLDTGKAVSLAELKGRPIVMNFWASWCQPCKLEHPILEWGYEQFGGDVVFVGVVFEDTEDGARKYLNEHGSSFPQLVDPRSGVAVDYGVAGVPETYFIDRGGIIREKHVGPISPDELVKKVRALLSGA